MTQQTINVGTNPNDGTGDPIRTAMTKINSNFNDFYNGTGQQNVVSIGNSSVNATVNATIYTGTSNNTLYVGTVSAANVVSNAQLTANLANYLQQAANGNVSVTTSVQIGGVIGTGNAAYINSTTIMLGNSTVNSFSNSTHFYTGNSTYFAFGNSTYDVIVSPAGNTVSNAISIAVTNASGNVTLTPISITLSNTTASVYTVNTSGLTIGSAANLTLTSNTLNLGTSNVGHTTALANGYSRMPNGLLMQWGTFVTVNTTAQVITFATATGSTFTTNCFSVTATSNSGATSVAVYAINATAFTIVSNNATSETANWLAIGI